MIGKERAALIDTGLGISEIEPEVRMLTDRPVIVMTTHAHWDHIGGHKYFEDIRIHKMDAGWLENGIPLPKGVISAVLGSSSFIDGVPKWFESENYTIYRAKPTALLEEGNVVDLGSRKLRIIHTPGHSPGHICVWEEATGYLAIGDMVYEGTLYCHFPSTDPVAYLASLNKIADLDINRILPGHNSLAAPPSLRKDLMGLLSTLCDKGELRHGMGLIQEKGISILL